MEGGGGWENRRERGTAAKSIRGKPDNWRSDIRGAEGSRVPHKEAAREIYANRYDGAKHQDDGANWGHGEIHDRAHGNLRGLIGSTGL
jgi:hypothetical protein